MTTWADPPDTPPRPTAWDRARDVIVTWWRARGQPEQGVSDAEAWRRAYLAHGDQLGALEAEAARDRKRP